MQIAYIIVTLLAIAANTYAAISDFKRADWILANMARLHIPESWLFALGALKLAGALGLLAGFVFPPFGIAAGVELVVFFIGAIVTAIRANWYAHAVYPAVWLVLAIGSLALRLAVH